MKTHLTISALIKEFIESRDVATVSKKTIQAGIKQFFVYLVIQGRPADKPNPSDIIRWKKHLLDCNKSVWTINSYLQSVKSFFIWLEEQSFYQNICKGVKPIRTPEGFCKEPLSKEELNSLMAIDSRSPKDQRNRLLIRLHYFLGLRSIEVSRLNVSDLIGLPDQPKLLIQGKGELTKKPIAITKELAAEINSFLNRPYLTDKNSPMFVSFLKGKRYNRLSAKEIGRQITARMEAAGINRENKSTHSLRHTAARDVLEATQDIYRTQLFMRHRNPQTTKIYLTYGQEHYLRQRELETILQKSFSNSE